MIWACWRVGGLIAFVMFQAGLAPLRGEAQPIPGVIIQKLSTNPANLGKTDITNLFDSPTILSDVVNRAWGAAREPVRKQIIDALGKPNMIRSKVTLYDIKCLLAESGDLQTVQQGNKLL